MSNDPYYNKSQAALIAVMQAFSADDFPELSLAELVTTTGLSKDASFRTLYMLHQAGWIEKHGERYALSQSWAQVGYRYLKNLDKKRNEIHQQIQEYIA